MSVVTSDAAAPSQYRDAVILTDVLPFPLWARPLGAYRVAQKLREAGLSCQVINGCSDFEDGELLELVSRFVDDRTRILGVSTTFLLDAGSVPKGGRLQNAGAIRSVLKVLKERHPRLRVVIGGTYAKDRSYPEADVYVVGYVESVIEKIFSVEVVPGSPVVINGMDGYVNTVSETEYRVSDGLIRGESLVLELSRGCRYTCTFCNFPMKGRKKGDYYKDAATLRAELLRNHEAHGIQSYILTDDTYNESVEKLAHFRDVFRTLPFEVSFGAYLRLDLIRRHPEMLGMLRDSGIRSALFGIESMNEGARKAVEKGQLSNRQILETLELVRREWGDEVCVTTSFIAGLPGEDAASIRSWMREVADPGFPSHRKMLFPLALSHENSLDIWASAIERDPGRFGYRITGPLGNNAGSFAGAEWESGTLDFQSARFLAAEFVALCRRNPCRADVFSHILLMGYGFSHEQLMQSDIFDPAWIREVDARVARRVAEYHVLLTGGHD